MEIWVVDRSLLSMVPLFDALVPLGHTCWGTNCLQETRYRILEEEQKRPDKVICDDRLQDCTAPQMLLDLIHLVDLSPKDFIVYSSLPADEIFKDLKHMQPFVTVLPKPCSMSQLRKALSQ